MSQKVPADDPKSNKLCCLVSSVQSHVRPFYSQSRLHVTDCWKISVESPNSRLSSHNCNVGFSIVDGGFQSYGIAFCDRKISPKSFIASSSANFPNLNGDSKICGKRVHSIHKLYRSNRDEINAAYAPRVTNVSDRLGF